MPSTLDQDVAVDEIAARLAAVVGDSFAAAETEERDRWRELAAEVVRLIGEDGYHWGCVSEEAADRAAEDAFDEGFDKAKERIIDGLARLERASMVEAEAIVEIVPRIREMTAGDEPVDNAPPTPDLQA